MPAISQSRTVALLSGAYLTDGEIRYESINNESEADLSHGQADGMPRNHRLRNHSGGTQMTECGVKKYLNLYYPPSVPVPEMKKGHERR